MPLRGCTLKTLSSHPQPFPCAALLCLQVGTHLLARLHALQDKHDIIGNVRGSGLMLGLEFVKDRHTKVRAAGRMRASTRTHTHARACTRTDTYTRAHAHTHACTHARAHSHTHTPTHTHTRTHVRTHRGSACRHTGTRSEGLNQLDRRAGSQGAGTHRHTGLRWTHELVKTVGRAHQVQAHTGTQRSWPEGYEPTGCSTACKGQVTVRLRVQLGMVLTMVMGGKPAGACRGEGGRDVVCSRLMFEKMSMVLVCVPAGARQGGGGRGVRAHEGQWRTHGQSG